MDQEKKILDKLWELTRQLSTKGRRKAEKLWKINSLRVEMASFRHRINVKFKELGRYVYESTKSGISDEDTYKTAVEQFFAELTELEGEIFEREKRIEELEELYDNLDLADEAEEDEGPPPLPEDLKPAKPKPKPKPKTPKKPAAKKPAAKKTTAKKPAAKARKPRKKPEPKPAPEAEKTVEDESAS